MKSSDILKSTNYNYNNLFIKKILEYNLSLHEFILLNYFINFNITELNIVDAKKHTSLNEKMIFEAYNGLICKNIVKIKVFEKDGIALETISLDEFYDHIDQSVKSEKNEKSLDDLIDLFEKSSGESASDIEREVMNAWLLSGFDTSMIVAAINEAKYNGTCNIRYIDKLVNEWNNKGIKNSDDLDKFLKTQDNKKNQVELFDYDWLDEK